MKEFDFNGTKYTFFTTVFLGIGCCFLAMVIHSFIILPIFPSMRRSTFIIIGLLTVVFFYSIYYPSIKRFRLQIINDFEIYLYNKNKLIYQSDIDHLVKIQAADIDGFSEIGMFILIFEDRKFSFSITGIKPENFGKYRSILVYFVTHFKFKKKPYYTKYGKSFNVYDYLNIKKLKK